ncbi:MAG: sigma-54 dependent transcriptional regulator [Alphaproteobacteria bacterium]|nr:sigma-54 dependent transcriptional regulator [Alphaproteobacteria bacterium]
MRSDILIVDDEADIRDLVSGILEDEGYEARVARDSESALQEIFGRCPSLIFLDIWLQGSKLGGLELLDMIKQQHPELPVVMISGHGHVEMAVSAIRRGAYDFIEKPFESDRLLLVTARALETLRLHREVHELRRKSGRETRIIGNSPVMSQLRTAVEKIAKNNARVLISGPAGSGKELIARNIHSLSSRCRASFVILNTAALDPGCIEVELFGSEPFSTDGRRHVGALEAAHGGTLYIDEIADIPCEMQAKILQVLIDQTFYRVRGCTPIKVDVRIISSSLRDLESEIEEGRLRADLFHRLNVVPIKVPTLAERRQDIPELMDYFLQQISRTEGLPLPEIGDDVMAIMQLHDWPGNVRQLRNNVESLMILSNEEAGGVITVENLPKEIGAPLPLSSMRLGMERLMALPLRDARIIFEQEYLMAQIERFGRNISKTSEFVGMERSALHRKLKLLGVSSFKRIMERGEDDV